MANETDPGANLQENQLVAKLISAGATNSITLLGYVGPSTSDASILIYESLVDGLSNSIEVALADILHVEDAPTSVLPFGGKVIWVKRDAKMTRRTAETVGNGATSTPRLVELNKGRLRMQLRRRLVADENCFVCQSQCQTCTSCAGCTEVCEFRKRVGRGRRFNRL